MKAQDLTIGATFLADDGLYHTVTRITHRRNMFGRYLLVDTDKTTQLAYDWDEPITR